MSYLFNLKRLRTRLVLAFVGMVLLSTGSLAIVSGLQFRDFVFAEAQNDLTTETLSLASSLTETLENFSSARRSTAFQQYLNTQAQQIHANIIVLDANGNFAIGNETANPDFSGQEIFEATNNRVGTDKRTNDNSEMIYTAAPVIYENSRIAIIQLSRQTTEQQEQIQQQWLWLALTVTVVTGLAFLFASWLSITLTKPLSQLQATVARYAKGHLSERFQQKAPYEIQALGDDFNTMAQELQSMLDEQRLFASNASHELRTPLASMKIRTELLLSDELDRDIQQQYLIEVDEEVTRLGGLIEDLFLLSRLDSDRLTIGHEAVDIRRLAGAVYRLMQAHIEQKSLQFTLDIADNLPNIQANTNHIRTILRNIVDNAIKYTPEGGTIIWSLRENNEQLCVVISDTGIGIKADDLEKITKRFYRADQAHSRTITGHGLGMALVQSIVTLYGGTLDIASDGEGRGTQVSVMLPIGNN